MNQTAKDAGNLTGRIFIAALFLMAGIGKLGAGYAGTQGYMESMGVPGILLPLVIALEIGGAILVIAGLFTRVTALALAGFTVVSAVLFHADFSDQMQMIMFMKNFAIAGGFLFLAANGAGAWSVDARRA
ncbi:MAG: DoxX family protein [Betaproteobacteria bacterium]|jgi:putative oxidoreductase|nr:MAG: DoxX family protein [Betaproteobacteria bacterium]